MPEKLSIEGVNYVVKIITTMCNDGFFLWKKCGKKNLSIICESVIGGPLGKGRFGQSSDEW